MILNWVLHKKYQRTRYINDPNLSNNSITQEIRVFDSGLALEISSDKTEVGIGPNHQATFTFNIKNFGDDWATGSQLSILIPKGINLLNSSMLGRSEQDSEGNTILTIDTGIIVDTKSVNITVEATGYSQPLDKLYDYLWDVNVYGKVTWDQDTQAPTLESKTIRVDSSKGIAEELVKSFLFGSASNQPNSLKTLTAFQKVTTSSEIVEGFMQIGDEYVNDLGTAVTSPIEKIFNTAGDTFSEQTKALKELNLKKGIEATQAGVKNTEQQVNQFPDNVKQGVEKARDKALIKGVGLLVDSATEEVFGPFISGSYQALKLASLSYSDGVVNYQKETNTDKVNLGVTVGKNEEVPQAILQSALAGNTSQIESWANSTVNNFTAQGSYSKTLPNGQVGLNYGYSNATKTLSYGIETSLSLGNGFRLGGKVEGQFGQGQPLPTAFLSVTYTEPEPKNPPQGDRSVSPQSYTNNLEKNFQSILAFADSTFSEPANLSQSIQSLTNGNDNSSTAILDKSGRFLVFTSEASNLIEGDTNGVTDVFIRDIQTKTLERISLSNDGTEANGKSEGFAISADGRYVVFASNASNLIANDSNNTQDIFLRDRITNTTQRVSLANDSSQTNGASDLAAISANGRYIVFSSIASNLVAGDTNEMVDVFVRDLEAGTTELISAASNNSQSNNDSLSPDAAISEDGRYVVFYSYASNLVANDTNEVADIFVRDRQTGLTVRVSAANDGAEGNDISLSPVISADGRYVAFSSLASNLVAGDTNGTGDIFVYDQQTKTIERVSLASDGTEADSNSSRPSISSDGRYVVFQSRASNFGVDNPDFYSNIYLRDRLTRETKLVSPSLNGETDGDSINPSISADGSYIAFESAATNLVDGDTNGTSDIFVYTLSASETSDAEINGIVWNDINGDSIKGSSEPTLTGWTIYLDSNNNNLLDAGETSTLSDSQGAYKFSNLSPNSYTVAQIIQDSYKQTYPVINVTTTASTEEIFTPSDSLSITSTTQNTNATKLINLDAFQTDPRFTNIKGQGYSTVIIDTGIDLDNPLFGADSDRNGIADKIIYEYDFADQDTDASDKNGHGSNIASIAASVASDANIIALKVFKDNGSGYFSDLEAALQWVNQNAQKYNIASVNLSLGDGQNWNTGNPRYGIGDELAAIASQNIIIAAAAGNSFYQFNSNPGLAYPAADSNTISVGAVWADNFGTNKSFSGGAIDYTTGADQIASFSQRSADQLDPTFRRCDLDYWDF